MNKNTVIGGMTFVLSIIILFVFIPQQVSEGDGSAMGPRFFPTMVTLGMAALSCLLIVQSLFVGKDSIINSNKKEPAARPRRLPLLLLVCFSFLYIAAMEQLGFMIPTIFFLSAALILFGENRKPIVVGISIVGSLVMFVVFGNFLNLLMPSGLFSPWFDFLLY